MSLISDALKTAQREKAGRSQSTKDPQPLLDGFFPYTATAKPRSRSRLVPVIAVSGAVIVLLAVTGWLMLSKPSRPAPGSRVPIVLPPPVTIAQGPARTDSAAAPSASTGSVEPRRAATPEPASGSPVVTAQQTRVSEPRIDAGVVRPREVVTATPPAVDSTSTSTSRAPGRVPDAAVARVDYEAKAIALFNIPDLVGARENFELATRYAPTARVWTNYGVTLQRLGDYSGAQAAYRAAVGMDANYLEAWLYQARLASEMKDVAKAIPLLQRALAINPHSAEVNIELARLESEAKNWTETRRFAEEAVRSEPTNSRAQWYLAVANDQLKDADAAIRAYTAYLQYAGAADRDQAQFVGWARTRLAELRGRP